VNSWTLFIDGFFPGAPLLLKANGHSSRAPSSGDQLIIEYPKSPSGVGSVAVGGDKWAVFCVEDGNWRVARQSGEYWIVQGRS
jgi:hypothetical protein